MDCEVVDANGETGDDADDDDDASLLVLLLLLLLLLLLVTAVVGGGMYTLAGTILSFLLTSLCSVYPYCANSLSCNSMTGNN